MNALLQNLLKLQSLEFGESTEKNAKTVIAELRGKIPTPVLNHYDRLRARGKKGIALVRNQVCTGCHMRVPIGMITTLMHNLDIQLCDSCGRYLYLSPEEGVGFSERATAPAKPVEKPRKRKAASPAAA
jgi:predicted  nucleic acid-binding Zn-ribbon protein